MKYFKSSLMALMISVSGLAYADDTIEVMHHWVSESEVDALNVIRSSMEEKGFAWEDSAVGGMSGANVKQALRTRLASGNPPAAMQLLGYESVFWAEEGFLRNLSGLAKKGNWEAVLPPQLLKFVKHDGKFIAAPVNMHRQNWVWANKAAFEKVDADAPKSWSELIETGKKLKKEGIIPLAIGGEPWQIGILMDALMTDLNGPEFYQKAAVDLDKDALKSPEMIKVFDTLRELRGLVDDNFSGRDWAMATQMVINGQAAMQVMGDWAKGEFLEKGLKPGQDFLCFATPGETTAFQFVIDSFGMFKTGDESIQRGQNALAETIMDKEVQRKFNLIKGSIPARTDVSVDDFDECAKLGYEQREQAIESGAMEGALTHGFASEPQFASVFNDVAAQFFVTDMSSEDAVNRLVQGIDNVR